MSSVTRSALHTEMFRYIAACPKLRCTATGVHRQFSCLGYKDKDINQALLDLQREGSITLSDLGILTIGDTATAA